MTVPSQGLARAAWCVAAALAAVHGVHSLLGHGAGALAWVSSGWTPFAVFVACGVACLARAGTVRAERSAWLVLGVGLLLYALGQAAFVTGIGSDGTAKFLTVPNLLWLAIYPLAILAMAQLVRAGRRQVRGEVWLDGAIGGLAVASLGVLLIFALVIDPLSALQAAPANLVFALGDLMVVGFGVAACGLLGWHPSRSLIVLILGFAAQGFQDVVYLDQLLQGSYAVGGFLDSAWLVTFVVIAAAAAWPRPRAACPEAVAASPRYGFPLAFAVLAVGTATFEGLAANVNALPVVMTSLTLAIVVVRFGFTFRTQVATIKALDRSEGHLELAQRLAGVGSWQWNAIERRATWSGEHARLHGWHTDEPPTNVEEALAVIDPRDRAMVADAVRRALSGTEHLSIEYRVRTPDGGQRVMHAEGTALRDDQGRHAGILGTCQDVTDRFRRAEAERANNAKSEFLSRMSHELRTPLNAILGFGQLLEADELSEGQRGRVGHILSSGRHLLGLVNEVLEISRIEAGETGLSLEPVHVGTALDEALALVGPLAGERNVKLAAAVEGDPWAHADQQRLKQVLLNLMTNAVKYNRPRGRVDVRVTHGHAGRVRLAISDTGRGIAEQDMHRVFVPFDRLDAEQLGVEGTGLGLSLSKALTEAMGGTIRVSSVVGAGTTFTIELAASAAPRLELPTADIDPSAPALLGPHPKVLCIEDNVSNLRLMEEIFTRRPSVELLTAVQGGMACDLARQHRPDLILLDLNLPDVHGDEVLQRLQADAATQDIPVVIVSADATRRQVERLLDLGAAGYLTKPVDVAELLRVVDDRLSAGPAMAVS